MLPSWSSGAPSGNRNPDPLIKSQYDTLVFYHVSQHNPCSRGLGWPQWDQVVP
jgi:hypothetical protein